MIRDEIVDELYVNELLRAILKLRWMRLNESINQLRFLQEEDRETVACHAALLHNLEKI